MKAPAPGPGSASSVAACGGTKGGFDHVANFFEAVAARREPISDVFSHHRALTTCHLAGIAARVGHKIKWDPNEERIIGDKLAQSLVAREKRSGFEIEM